MKAAVLREFKSPLIIEEIAQPQPAAHEVLIAVEACGVCHSDLHLADADWPQLARIIKKPLVLGHDLPVHHGPGPVAAGFFSADRGGARSPA